VYEDKCDSWLPSNINHYFLWLRKFHLGKFRPAVFLENRNLARVVSIECSD